VREQQRESSKFFRLLILPFVFASQATAFVTVFASVALSSSVSRAQSPTSAALKACPTDPDELSGMIDELKGTFECSGLNLRECNEYRTGLIGGGIAASVAAGIGAFRARPNLMACMIPGRSASFLNEEMRGRPAMAMLALGLFGPLAESAPTTCRFPTKELGKEFREMSDEHFRESKALRGEMLDRIMAQKAPDALKKVEVPEAEIRKHFVEGLEQLERQVRADNSGKLAVHKQWMLDDIAKLKSQYRSAGSYADMVSDFGRFSANFNLQGKTEFIDPATLKNLRIWDLRESLRAEKVANLSDPALKAAYQKALIELDTFAGMSQMSGKASYLKGLGYSPDFVEKMMSAEGVRQKLQFRGSMLQGAAHELHFGQLSKKAFLESRELEQLTRQRGLMIFEHPIFRWGHMPGLNNSAVKTVAKAGRAAMAKISSVAAGDLAGLAKYGLKGVALVGSKAFAAVSETAFHMNDAHCGGGNPGQFVTVSYDAESSRCAASNERSELTDAFLFGLSREEQLKEIQQSNGTCEMLMGLHARYSPSQNWSLSCEGGEATLSGLGEDGAGQMLKFNASRVPPEDLRWYSADFESCAKVAMRDGQIDHANIYEYEAGETCGAGSAVRMTESLAWSRGAVTDQRKLMRQFTRWHKHNAFAMVSAAGCCRGETTSFCPTGKFGSGPSKVRTNRPTGTSK
jgi:hypothetical protein